MEYLMTYGWAILIVAVVLAALFQLGVFSGVMSPRAQPGTCRVVRPMGAGTSAYSSLQGVCTGLLPQFVAQFNGQSSHVSAGQSISPSTFTIAVWLKAQGAQIGCPANIESSILSFDADTPAVHLCWAYAGQGLLFLGPSNYRYFYSSTLSDGDWHQLAITVPGNGQVDIANALMYVDGASTGFATLSNSGPQSAKSGAVHIGGYGRNYFNGSMANIQIYNTTLTANEALALFKEGIGGAPIRVDKLVGWWPLNGNANDTSGNLNSGVPVNVAYTSSWTGGYALR